MIVSVLVGACGGVLLVAIYSAPAVPLRIARNGQFDIVATPEHPIVHATAPGEVHTVRFRLENHGVLDVELGEVASSCGCAVVVRPANTRLRPGEIAVLAVKVTPPAFGEQIVAVSIPLSASGASCVMSLPITLHGASLAQHRIFEIPNELALRSLTEQQGEREFEIRTVEPRRSDAWISALSSTNDRIQAELISSEVSRERLDGTNERTYLWRVRAIPREEWDEWDGARLRPVFSSSPLFSPPEIRVNVVRRSPWHVYPDVVNFEAGKPCTEIHFTMTADREEFGDLEPGLQIAAVPTGCSIQWIASPDRSSRVLRIHRDPEQAKPVHAHLVVIDAAVSWQRMIPIRTTN